MRYLVCVPAFNAAETIGELIGRISRVCPIDVLVIDDGSQDNTAKLARATGVEVISHPVNRGKGEALKSAFAEAGRREVDAVICMDADLQHEPESLPEFTKAFERDKTDVIIGTRDFNVGGMPRDRYWTNRLTSYAITRMGGVKVADSQSGYRLLSKRAIEIVHAPSSNYDFESEYLILAARAGLTFGSVPISTIYAGQKSSIHKWTDTMRFLKLVRRYWGSRPKSRS